jgi:hypothetical protein
VPQLKIWKQKSRAVWSRLFGRNLTRFFLCADRDQTAAELAAPFRKGLEAWKAGLFYSSQQTGTFASSIPSIAKLKHRQIGTRKSWIPGWTIAPAVQ